MRRRGALAALLLATALACASGPPKPRGTEWLPPIAPGLARLVIYHTRDTDVTLFHPMLTLAGEPVGELPIGTFLYADRPPGVYEVAVQPQPNFSAFGGQAPTKPVPMMLVAGEVSYLQFYVYSTPTWINVILTPTDPPVAQGALSSLTLTAPPGSE